MLAIGCSKQTDSTEPFISLDIDPSVCRAHTVQYAHESGTDRIAVEGAHDNACKVVVSRERAGTTAIYDCTLPAEGPTLTLRRTEGKPFEVRAGRLECKMVARAEAGGTVTDTRADSTVYRPFE